MVFDLVAGTKQPMRTSVAAMVRPPRVLVFDSGLGGLTVYPEVTAVLPNGSFFYLADDAVFPYGGLKEPRLVERVIDLMRVAIAELEPDVVVVACGTASTLVLPPLRAAWPDISFVGTVPAIKPAAMASSSKRISVLATPGTVAREYTRDLVRTFAGECAVTLVGCPRLASLAEEIMRGAAADTEAIAAEIAPAFVDEQGRRTDTVVLACTHYPLLLPLLESLASWPVRWIDPAPAIARRVQQVAGGSADSAQVREGEGVALFTSNLAPGPALKAFLAARGLKWQSSASLAAVSRPGSV